jgi:anti-sigma-K factor RskA
MPALASHQAEHEEDAALYALGALEGAERSGFEAHLGECAICQKRVADDQDTLSQLPDSAPLREPSADLKSRLLASASAELEAEPKAAPNVVRLVQPSLFRRLLAPVAAVVLIGLTATAGVQFYFDQPAATYKLEGTRIQGSASVVLKRSGQSELRMALPDVSFDRVYQVWMIDPGQAPRSVGTTSIGFGSMTLPLDPRGKVVALTREIPPGAPAPTEEPVLLLAVPG